MDLGVMVRTVALLNADDIAAALRCVALLESAGQLTTEEAREWRRRIRRRAAFLGLDEEPSG